MSIFSEVYQKTIWLSFMPSAHRLNPRGGMSYLYIMLEQYVEYIKKDVCQI